MSLPDRILVRLPNWLGDVLMSRALLHAIRRARPEATVWGVGPAALIALVENDGVLDRALPWPAASGVLNEITAWRPGIAWVLPPSFSSAWFAFRTNASRRVGFRGEWRDLLLTDAVRRPARGEMHLSEEYLLLGSVLGVRAAETPPLRPRGADVEQARARLDRLGIGSDWVVLAPGAIYGPAKRWAPGRFAALGRRFHEAGIPVLVCGAASDREPASRVAAEIGAGAHALAGETSLGEQLALCAGARITVSNDSGLAHLAAASGAPTLAIFGSTSSAWTAPRGARAGVVQRAPVCSPCFQRTCRIGYVCLERIAVEQVWRAATALIAAPRPEAA